MSKPSKPQLAEAVQTGEDTYEERPMTRPCYECGGFDGVTAPERAVVGLFVTNQRQDPTQAYELVCGHATIDC